MVGRRRYSSAYAETVGKQNKNQRRAQNVWERLSEFIYMLFEEYRQRLQKHYVVALCGVALGKNGAAGADDAAGTLYESTGRFQRLSGAYNVVNNQHLFALEHSDLIHSEVKMLLMLGRNRGHLDRDRVLHVDLCTLSCHDIRLAGLS